MISAATIGDLVAAGSLVVARGVPRRRTGTRSDVSRGEVAVVTPTELRAGGPFVRRTSMAEATRSGALLVEPGDVLVTLDGGGIGTPFLVRRPLSQPVVPSQGAATLRLPEACPLLPGFLYAWLASPGFQEEASRRTTGTAMQHLAWRDFLTIAIPVPALDRQRQIAKTVETYLDALEAQRRLLDVTEGLFANDLDIIAVELKPPSVPDRSHRRLPSSGNAERVDAP